MVIWVSLFSAPAGTTTLTPAAGMLSTPPLRPIVLLTVMLLATGVLRSTPFALVSPSVLVRGPTRPPSRSCDPGAGEGAALVGGGGAADGSAGWSVVEAADARAGNAAAS